MSRWLSFISPQAHESTQYEVVIIDMSGVSEPSEHDSIGTTNEKKYYQSGSVFVKRTLRPNEYRTGPDGLHIPRLGPERLINEAAALQFIHENTDIPVPRVYGHFASNQAYYLIREWVPGVELACLWEDQKPPVYEQLRVHLAKLKSLRSNKLGGPSGIVVPPYRALQKTDPAKDHFQWRLRDAKADADADETEGEGEGEEEGEGEYVFCHNDLCQQNVIVDSETLKITGIIDWEEAGFFPEWFEREFFTRLGPSVVKEGEVDDGGKLVAFLESRSESAGAG